jgi:hypothetical protein
MKTRPIGERFQDGDVTLEVKNNEHCAYCAGCYYGTGKECVVNDDVAGGCLRRERTDRTSVIFVKVKP